MSNEPIESPGDWYAVGWYRTRAATEERMLVVLAMGRAARMERVGSGYGLFVEGAETASARAQLTAYERERRSHPDARWWRGLDTVGVCTLFVFGWGLPFLFLLQSGAGEAWVERFAMDVTAFHTRGEWGRAVTALFLHGDLAHLFSNIAFGAVFFSLVLVRFGTGLGWALVLASGALGNSLNAWMYRGAEHVSLGASTAVFGAMGLLAGLDASGALSARANRWRWLLPVGGAAGFLALLGSGENGTDVFAHLWGMASGAVLGVLSAQVGESLLRRGNVQWGAAGLAILMLAWSWTGQAWP